MFILAVLGNATYGLGIFLYSVEPVFLLRKLPWLVGSVGTLCFDFTVSLSLSPPTATMAAQEIRVCNLIGHTTFLWQPSRPFVT